MIGHARRNYCKKGAGFSLLELLVATSVGAILLLILFQVASDIIGGWEKGMGRMHSEADVREIIEAIGNDLESTIYRPGKTEWLRIKPTEFGSGDGLKDQSWVTMVLPARDRLVNEGDLCAIAYRLAFEDPAASDGQYKSINLYRMVVDPEDTYGEILGKENLHAEGGYWTRKESLINLPQNLVAADIADFRVSVTFVDSAGRTQRLPSETEMRIVGTTVETSPPVEALNSVLQLKAFEISITTLSRTGAILFENGDLPLEEIIKRHGRMYTRVVHPVPFSSE